MYSTTHAKTTVGVRLVRENFARYTNERRRKPESHPVMQKIEFDVQYYCSYSYFCTCDPSKIIRIIMMKK